MFFRVVAGRLEGTKTLQGLINLVEAPAELPPEAHEEVHPDKRHLVDRAAIGEMDDRTVEVAARRGIRKQQDVLEVPWPARVDPR